MRALSSAPLIAVAMLLAACGGEPPPATPPGPTAEAAPPPPPPEPARTAEAPPPPEPAKTTAPAPAPEPAPPPADDKKKVPGANLTVGSMKADGVELKEISCKVDGPMGLLGAIVLVSGFKSKKAQLDGCSKGKVSETTLSWTADGGKITKVKVEGGDAKVGKCVEKALTGAPAPMPAACMATLVHGK